MKIENRLSFLQSLINSCYRSIDKNDYYLRRFDKQFIVDLTRQLLAKRGYKTQYSDIRLYEFAFNCIEHINITLPTFRRCGSVRSAVRHRSGTSRTAKRGAWAAGSCVR